MRVSRRGEVKREWGDFIFKIQKDFLFFSLKRPRVNSILIIQMQRATLSYFYLNMTKTSRVDFQDKVLEENIYLPCEMLCKFLQAEDQTPIRL